MRRNVPGFTIVELLVVIVVIAILAAISIVAYRGIQARAAETVLKSDLRNASTQLAMYRAKHSSYPATKADLKTSDGTSFEYDLVEDGYCLTATSNRSNVAAFNVSPVGGIQEGACQGHSGGPADGGSDGPTITNYIENPSVEVSLESLSHVGTSSIARDTARAHTGSASLRVTMGEGGWSSQGARLYYRWTVETVMKPNTTYTASAYVYVPAGTTNIQMSIQGSGLASGGDSDGKSTSVKGQWVRVQNTFTTADTGTLIVYLLNYGVNDTAGMQFWADSLMITEGDQPYDYADGSSSGWSWKGAEGLSASEGPA